MDLHKSNGVLRYSHDNKVGFKLILEVDRGIYFFYRNLIPKYYHVQPQAHHPHISIVRKETPVELDYWEKHAGERISYVYDIDIKHDNRYWWLDCYSKEFDSIRAELGLTPPKPWTPLPPGFDKRYHMTLGNTKFDVILA